jgi:hypothetical protein
VKLLSNKPANLLTKYEIQQIQNQGITHQTPNNENPKQLSFHACADYANQNRLESCCTQIFPMLALYTHVHDVRMVPSFHVPMHVLKKVGEGKIHTRRRESMLFLDVGCGTTILRVLVYYLDTIT